MRNYSAILLLIASLLSACGGAPAAAPTAVPAPTAAPAPTSAPTAAPAPTDVPVTAGYPVTIENCGRKLTFDEAPTRVVSLWQPPNELLLALGLQDHIIALAGNYTDLRPDLAPAAEGIKVIGTSMQWPSKEVLLSEKPDLVISEGIEGFMYDTSQGYPSVAEIEATGAKVLSTGGSCTPSDPKTQTKTTQQVYDDLLMLGQVFGVSDRAEALVKELQDREAAVLAKLKGLEPVKVAFYNGGEGPVNVLTVGIWADLMRKAGGQDVITTKGYQVSNEEFAAGQPDVILIGFFPGQDPKDSIAFLKKTFPNIPAVMNDRLVPIATIDTEASVRVVDGLEQIATALHPEAFTAASTTSGYPVTIENCGRTLTFEQPPERVITTWQALPELLVTLGLGDRIIGTQWNNQFEPPPDIAEEFGSLPVLSKEYASKEAIFTANPDLILSAGLTWDFDPNNGSPSLAEVEAAGIKVFGLGDNCTADSRVTIDDMYADILTIGRIFGVESRASMLIADMKARVAAVQERVSSRAPIKAFFDAGGEGPVGTAGKGLQHDMITLAGGENVFGDRPNYYESVSLEEIAVRQPEIFVVDTWEDRTYINTRTEWLFKTFPNTPAGEGKRFVEIPGIYIYYASVRFADGVETMARAFHPEVFK